MTHTNIEIQDKARVLMNNIAIIAWGAMADVLYATPIVRHVRRINPEAKISWLIRDKFAEVIDTNPDINHIVKFALPEGFNSRQEAEYVMDQNILAYAKANFDQVVDLQYWPRHSNFYENPQEDFISLRARNAGFHPLSIDNRKIVSYLTDEDVQIARKFLLDNTLSLENFITVNHISYAAAPVCSFDYYQQLVDILTQKRIFTVFTGATNEPIPTNCVDARGLSYRVWQALIAMSNLYLGLDSGAKTLACATDVSIIILHSRDFPLKKTGCAAMGIRTNKIMELTTIPTATSLAEVIDSIIHG